MIGQTVKFYKDLLEYIGVIKGFDKQGRAMVVCRNNSNVINIHYVSLRSLHSVDKR